MEADELILDPSTYQLSPSPEKSQDEKRPNSRRMCTGMRTRTQTASSRRRSMATSSKKKHVHKTQTSPSTPFKPEVDVIPDTQEQTL